MSKKGRPRNTFIKVRYDSHNNRLAVGEDERKDGLYTYRWSENRKRHCVYAPTLQLLREKEELIITGRYEGIPSVEHMTLNDLYDLWAKLKRGIKGTTMSGYRYSYNHWVRDTFVKNLVQRIKKSDVRGFYNTLHDEHHLRITTLDGIHNVLHQVFQVAVDDEIIRLNPASNALKELKLAHGSDAEKRTAMTLEQQKIFINYLLSSDIYRHWYPIA